MDRQNKATHEVIYSFCDFLSLTMFACEVVREEQEREERKEQRNVSMNKTCMNSFIYFSIFLSYDLQNIVQNINILKT